MAVGFSHSLPLPWPTPAGIDVLWWERRVDADAIETTTFGDSHQSYTQGILTERYMIRVAANDAMFGLSDWDNAQAMAEQVAPGFLLHSWFLQHAIDDVAFVEMEVVRTGPPSDGLSSYVCPDNSISSGTSPSSSAIKQAGQKAKPAPEPVPLPKRGIRWDL